MTMIFGRVYKLEIGNGSEALVIDGFEPNPLQITFTIEQTPGNWLSYAEITVYGLNRDSRNRIREEYEEVRLIAGYREQYGQIFAGNLFNVEFGRDGPDSFVRLYCRSEAAPDEVNLSWGPGTPRIDVIRDVAASFQRPVEIVGDFSHLPPVDKGLSIFMERKLAMHFMSDEWGFDWMIRNQTVFILAKGETIPDAVYRYSATTGLIGSPRVTILGCDATVSLNPALRPGAVFELEAETGAFTFNEVYYRQWPDTVGLGRYKINSMQITGDFYGDAWEMALEGLRV
ncbi:tubulin-specific chaperone D [Alloalcanivorax xenomutans]